MILCSRLDFSIDELTLPLFVQLIIHTAVSEVVDHNPERQYIKKMKLRSMAAVTIEVCVILWNLVLVLCRRLCGNVTS